MDKKDLPIIPPNGREIHNIEFLAGLDAQLQLGGEILKDRLKMIPNGWRDFRLAIAAIERVLDAVYETVPDKTLRHMRMLQQFGQIIIRPKPAIPLPDDVQIVGSGDLKTLINCVVANECAMCVRNAKEQKGCKLRKCMETVAPTMELPKDGHCTYIDVAAGNEFGKYI